jgi:hypothetical protein
MAWDFPLTLLRTLETAVGAFVRVGYLPAVLAPYYLAFAALRALELRVLMSKPAARYACFSWKY